MMHYSVHEKIAALKDLKDSIFERSKQFTFLEERRFGESIAIFEYIKFCNNCYNIENVNSD